MKISEYPVQIKPAEELVLCFDVAKAHLNLFIRTEEGEGIQTIEDEIPNKTEAIEELLRKIQKMSRQYNRSRLRVVCESSGGYEQKLLQTARRLGHQTALVSCEHVAKLKNVESNDSGKSDIKDPRIMEMIVRLGKTQHHRSLPPIYIRLRHLNRFYDAEDRLVSKLRQRIQQLIHILFPDYDKKAFWTFGASGCAFMKAYAFNPYQMLRSGAGRFEARMRRLVPHIRRSTLNHLFDCAQASVRYHIPSQEIDLLVDQLKRLWSDWERHQARLGRLRVQIEALGAQLQEQQAMPKLDQEISGLTLFNLTRLLGETGPLDDFPGKKALLRYAGLNLRRRQSGTYKGRTRISKKGRPLLRKILAQTIFPLLRRVHLYGDTYKRKREKGMVDQKARVAIMRKFLCMLYGVHRSNHEFDLARLHQCQSQFKQNT